MWVYNDMRYRARKGSARRHRRTALSCNLLRPKRFKTLIKILAISASFCLPAIAQEYKGWQLDSLPANSSVSKAEIQQIYDILLKMLDRWNAHDIEGYMEVYWKSPELLVVVDAEQINGWQQLHDSYINGYPDRSAMGFIQPKRVQVKLLKPDLALALTWSLQGHRSSVYRSCLSGVVMGHTCMSPFRCR